jgi:hypothetical protein
LSTNQIYPQVKEEVHDLPSYYSKFFDVCLDFWTRPFRREIRD